MLEFPSVIKCHRKSHKMEETLKLERLKLPSACGTTSNENVFREISKETGTLILWESGCKTPPIRKEPYIKISGPEENIKKAKEMLLDRMEIQSNRVVMKMDVTHFEHPSLIGKGGMLIKQVMKSTGCHIHFPDSNKCSGLEKSNHVSIYGDPMNVERARVMLRALIPVQIYFEVPPTSCFAPILEAFPPESKFLASHFGLLVYSAPSHNGTTVVVRCNQDQFPNLKKEIVELMEFICCTNWTNLPPVHIRTDIVHHHQTFVKGSNSSNIEAIMKRTGAEITFPDINAEKVERSSVKISGNLDCVYVAWQEIMNILPVSVSFDVNETRETKGEYMDFLKDCGISVYSRPKPKYYIKNVTVKGPEKFSELMLQYRQHLLRLPTVNFIGHQDINLASNFLASLTDHPSPNTIPSSVSSIVTKNLLAEISQLTDYYMQPNPLTAVPSVQEQKCIKSLVLKQTTRKDNGYGSDCKPADKNLKSPEYFLSNDWFKSIPPEAVNQALADLTISQTSLSSDQVMENKGSPDSCNLFMGEKNSESLAEDYYRKKALAAKAMRRPIKSVESAQVPTRLWAGYGFSQSMPASVIKDNLDAVNQYYFNYNNNGDSRSSSEDSEAWENVVLKDCLDGNIWSNSKETTFSHSNYFDSRNMPVPDYITKDILPELLWQHGLQKYIDVFTKEEIDYQTFLLLTHEDLLTLGIAPHARMKIVCLIRELQETRTKFSSRKFNAAPGAERKSESIF